MTWWGAKRVLSQDINNLTSIPLMMEKPAKRPRVPPMTASWSMNVVFESFVIRSNVGLLMKMVTMCKVLSASQPEVFMYNLCLILNENGLHLLSEPQGLLFSPIYRRYTLSSPFPFQGFLCWCCGWSSSIPSSHLKRKVGGFPCFPCNQHRSEKKIFDTRLGLGSGFIFLLLFIIVCSKSFNQQTWVEPMTGNSALLRDF